MTIYDFVDNCRQNNLTSEEAEREWADYQEECKREFEERYNSNPLVNEGWKQQDLIDAYRRER